MSSFLKYNRRLFLNRMSMAIGAVGLGISGIAKAQTNNMNISDILLINGELSSLARANGWLNTPRLRASELKGKVVVINFWTYTCINWMRVLPYVREWSKKYKEQGLIVIGVHTPEFAFEHNLSNVRKMASDLRVDYPVAIDNDRGIWDTFSNHYWPALYVLDAKGKIRHHQFGEGGYVESEQIIQQLLLEAGAAGINNELMTVEGKGVEAPADWNNLLSAENYLGLERTENFSSPEDAVPNKRKTYSVPAQLKLNQWAVLGDWMFKDENILLQQAGGRIAYKFHARDLHLVMGPAISGRPVQFRILIDGEAPGSSHGTDVDEKGNGVLAEQRLYQLVRQDVSIIDRVFEIEFADAGVEAFSFTFG